MNTSTTTIVSEVDAFVASQNTNRGGALAGGVTLPLDYDLLTTTVPAGANAVTGISGIAAGTAGISFASAPGNAVIFQGVNSSTASTSGVDSFAINVDATGKVTVVDNNTGNSETIAGASYLVFDGGATTATGAYQSAYLIETGTNAEIASMYNAAFQRVPDFAGIEYYTIPIADGAMTLHQAAIYFLASPEFAKDYPALTAPADDGGPNDQVFITELYGNILHRTPSAAEVQYYVGALQGTLTTSSGTAIPACDRAQLLIYFSISPENQSDISAADGGWLINPANGYYVQPGATLTISTTALGDAVAAGVVDTADFQNPTSSTYVTSDHTTIVGAGNTASGLATLYSTISTAAPNITIDLSANINVGTIEGQADVLNGYSGGGSIVITADINPAYQNAGGTVNLFGNGNTIESGGHATGVTVATVVNGWNSTDLILPNGGASAGGALYTGSANSPVNGSSISFTGQWVEVNVGSIANDSAAAMASAASAAYKVADVASEKVVFIGQDPNGNTMIYHWGGDASGSHAVAATDFTGAIELVGAQASSLVNANFHS